MDAINLAQSALAVARINRSHGATLTSRDSACIGNLRFALRWVEDEERVAPCAWAA